MSLYENMDAAQAAKSDRNVTAATESFAKSTPVNLTYMAQFGDRICVAFGCERFMENEQGKVAHALEYMFSAELPLEQARVLRDHLTKLLEQVTT